MQDPNEKKNQEYIDLNLRLKFFGVCLLLCLALVAAILTAAGTVRSYQQFQQSHHLAMTGSVDTVRPWMTLPYISHIYHIPTACLAQSLHLTQPMLIKQATLRTIADYVKRPVDALIQSVQRTILDFRKNKSMCSPPVSPTKPDAHQMPLSNEKGTFA